MLIRVAACQILTYRDVERSCDKILEWMHTAAEKGVDVIAFPEASLCGYVCDPDYWAAASPDDFVRAEERIVAASKELDIAVVLGTAHWEDGTLFNSLLAIDQGGVIRGRYAKTHLAEDWPNPGRTLPIYTLAGVPSCFLVCHDIRYPELVRLPAIAGAQICYYCSNESGLTEEHKLSAYRAMPLSRATENTVFLVMCNAPADAQNLKSPSQSHGNSKIIHPDGYPLVEAGLFEERLVISKIDVDDATRSIAERATNDETILKRWMQEGVKLVSDYR
jgi:predicted amidohydrolase